MSIDCLEIQGDATLCFGRLRDRFEGIISANDGAQFAICGTKTQRRRLQDRTFSLPAASSLAGCGCRLSETSGSFKLYDIEIVDHEVGEEYMIRQVHTRDEESITVTCGGISFQTDKTFKGARALMMAKELLGGKFHDPEMILYEGKFKAIVEPSFKGRHWVL